MAERHAAHGAACMCAVAPLLLVQLGGGVGAVRPRPRAYVANGIVRHRGRDNVVAPTTRLGPCVACPALRIPVLHQRTYLPACMSANGPGQGGWVLCVRRPPAWEGYGRMLSVQ